MKEREKNKLSVALKSSRCSSGYPPAEGRVEHSQRNSSQENYIIFSLERKKRMTEGEQIERKWESTDRRRARKEDVEDERLYDKEDEEEDGGVWREGVEGKERVERAKNSDADTASDTQVS